MAIPLSAVGYGNNSTARNVFGVLTSEDLSSPIKYYCYDNDQEFPTVDTVETVANVVLAGTSGNSNKSMVCLVDTTNAAPTSDWKPSSASAGEENPNRMKGTTNYVEQDGSILSASGRATFNMVVEVPSDAATTDAMGFDLKIVFSYTGSAPTITFQVNEGTEGTPTWTSLTTGTHGVKHCRAGTGTADQYANIPESGTEDTVRGIVTT